MIASTVRGALVDIEVFGRVLHDAGGEERREDVASQIHEALVNLQWPASEERAMLHS